MEENKRVFICDVDYLYTEQSPEYEKYEGGAVYIFINAFDVREVLDILLKSLAERNLEPQEIVSIAPYDINQEWDTEEIQTHYLMLYKECETINQIVYDDFLAYERGEEGE